MHFGTDSVYLAESVASIGSEGWLKISEAKSGLREINQTRTKDEYQANDFFEVESSVGSEKHIVQEPTVKLVRKEPRKESLFMIHFH